MIRICGDHSRAVINSQLHSTDSNRKVINILCSFFHYPDSANDLFKTLDMRRGILPLDDDFNKVHLLPLEQIEEVVNQMTNKKVIKGTHF